MFIPGFIISIITFPGVIVHEMAHQLFCRFSRVAVLDACYFRVENPNGYIVHEIPKKSWQNLLIAIGPFFLNTIVGALIASAAAIPVFRFDNSDIFDYLLIWLGISIAMHSFPSTGDAKSIWSTLKGEDTPIWVKIIGTPIVGLIYICSIGSVAWLDLIYGAGVAMLIPNLLVKIIA